MAAAGIRLVACDLDGTLLRPDGGLFSRATEELSRLHRQGIPVVIATGRSWRTALKVQSAMGIRGPFVAHNGAYAYDTRTRRELHVRRVGQHAARAIWDWATARGVMVRSYLGVGRPVYFNRFTDEHVARFLRPEDRVASRPEEWIGPGPLEIFLFGSTDVTAFLELFGTNGPDYEATVFPHEGGIQEVNICAPHVDKVEGVQAVARTLGIPSENVLVIGDGENDVRLMEWAGYAVAMGNGHPDAKRVADYVTPLDAPEPVVDALAWAWSTAWQHGPRPATP
jgi:Cof subfamily protein (haloacid dehalogenase superfamily)